MRRAVAALSIAAAACNPLTSAPTPTPVPLFTEFVIPTPSPKPSPTAFTGHYGFLVAGPNGFAIRSETSDSPIGTIDLAFPVVSPDGGLVAGWTRTTPAELRIVDVAKPAQFSKVLTLPAGERAGAIAWEVDEAGILYAAESQSVSSAQLPAYSALRTVEVAANGTAKSPPKEIARFDNTLLRPAVWNHLGGDFIAALAIVPGTAKEFIAIRGTDAPQRRPLPDGAVWQQDPAISGDGRWIVMAAQSEQLVRWFRTDDASFVVQTHGAMTEGGASAWGRPQTGGVGVVLDRGLVIYDGDTGARGRVPTEGIDQIVGWRFDGSAAIVRMGQQLALVEIGSWNVTKIGADVRAGVRLP